MSVISEVIEKAKREFEVIDECPVHGPCGDADE